MINVRSSRTRAQTREKLIPDVTPDRPVIYVRKSSEGDDEQAASHERQRRDLNEVIIRDGWDVDSLSHYEESRSAKLPGRPFFNEMMSRIEAGELNVVYTHEISRLVRNMLDGGRLIHFLQRGLIRRIVTPYRIYHPEDNTLLIAIEASISTEEIRKLVERIASSIRNKHAKGQYPGRAPAGYMNDLFGIKGDRAILVDPECFEIVRSLWDAMLTGVYTVRQIAKQARQRGLMTRRYGKTGGRLITYSTVHAMFCNPFYCGLYQWNNELYEGCHKPMVTTTEFDRVQKLLARPSLPRPQGRRVASELVPYMGGLLYCGTCRGSITAEAHTKISKSGVARHYVYLRCTKKEDKNCPEQYLSLGEFEMQVAEILQNFTLPDSIAAWALKILREENNKEHRVQKETLDQIQSALRNNQQACKRLTDMLLSGRITEADFDQRKTIMEHEAQELSASLVLYTSRSNQWLEEVEKAFLFCKTLHLRFETGSPIEKRTILELVGSNRQIRGKKVYIEPDELFVTVREGNENGDWSPLLEHVRKISQGQTEYFRRFLGALNPCP